MFTSLLDPLVGPESGEDLSPEREELTVSLLALNFPEDLELGPLLRYADGRLAPGASRGLAESTAVRLRSELRSMARRVADRQVAGILGTAVTDRRAAAQVFLVELHQESDFCLAVEGRPDSVEVRVRSPDGSHRLDLTACDPDWVNQKVRINDAVKSVDSAVAGDAPDPNDISGSFTLTWFDLPLTDNLLLPDGNRFAVGLRAMHNDSVLTLKIIWFPKWFFTPRERPTDYAKVAGHMGLAGRMRRQQRAARV